MPPGPTPRQLQSRFPVWRRGAELAPPVGGRHETVQYGCGPCVRPWIRLPSDWAGRASWPRWIRSRTKAGHPGLLPVLILVVYLAWSSAGGAARQATGPVYVAGIVVDFGDGRVSYALVPFTEETISGVELLRRSGLSLLSVEFGGMGEGICAIEETGCDLSTCRARLCQTGDPDSPFWQYVRHGGDGEWQSAPLGASSSRVEDGDVDGWFWTDTAPGAAGVTLETIASETGVALENYRSTTDPEPVMATVGDSENDDLIDRGDVVAGITAIIGVAAIGGLLVLRSRRGASR